MSRKAAYIVDGKPCSSKEIRSALNDYINDGEVHGFGIGYTTLQGWRNGGVLRAKRSGTRWLYYRPDLLKLINSSKG